MSKVTGFQEKCFDASNPDSVQFCLGPSTKQYLNAQGKVECNPHYILFPYDKPTKLSDQEIKVAQLKWQKDGGKEAFRTLFSKLNYNTDGEDLEEADNNEKRWAFILAMSWTLSANFHQIIRAKHTQGQFPVKVIVSEEKGTGKSWCLDKCLWVGSDQEFKLCARSSEQLIKHKLGE